MSSIITGTSCRSSICCEEVDGYLISNSVEQSITDIALPWGYYLMREGSDNLVRVDETGQGHHLASVGESTPERVDGYFTPWANEFTDSALLQSEIATMDTLADQWAVHLWLYLDEPAATGTVFVYGEGTDNRIALEWFWVDPELTFRLQVGEYPDGVTPYYNIITLTPTLPVGWLMLGASYNGDDVILQVNNTTQIIPALALDGPSPPDHGELDERFYFGPMAGIIGPVGIWTPGHSLTTDNLERLWNDGNGIALSF